MYAMNIFYETPEYSIKSRTINYIRHSIYSTKFMLSLKYFSLL